MHRRALIASLPVGAVPLFSGCVDWTTASHRISLASVDSAEVTHNATRTADDLSPSPLVGDLVSALLDEEAITLELSGSLDMFEHSSFHHGPVYYRTEEGEPVYRFDRETLDEGTVTGPKYEISRIHDLPDDVSATDEGEVLPFTDLPEYERWRVHEAFTFSDGRLIFFTNSVVIGYLEPDWEENSRLLGGVEQRFLEFNDRYVELKERETVSEPVQRIRVSGERFAEDEDSFAERILDEYAVDATAMSEDAQQLLDDVRENGGSLTTSNEDSGFEEQREILEEFESKRAETETPPGERPGAYILYEDEYYRLSWSSHVAP